MAEQQQVPVAPETASEPVVEKQDQPANAAPEAESTPTPPADAEKEARKAFRGVEKRIAELTRQKYEAEERGRREAEHWRQRAEALEAQYRAAEASKPLPKLGDYQDIEAYTADLAAAQAQRIVDQRLQAEREAYWAAEQQRQQAFQAQQAQQSFVRELDARITAAEKKFPDFREKVGNPELPSILGTPAFGAVWESEHGAEVMYHLANNPMRLHQILSLSPVGQVREIARIESALQAGRAVTGATPPPETVGSNTGNTPDPKRMTTEQWMEWREKELAAKRKR